MNASFRSLEKSRLILDSDSSGSNGSSPSGSGKQLSVKCDSSGNVEMDIVDMTSSYNDVGWVIFDCSAWCFIDSVAMEYIKQVHIKY